MLIFSARAAHTKGAGHASNVFATDHRKCFMREVFGCPMVGTFNIQTPKDFRESVRRMEPHHSATEPVNGSTWKFFLCEVQKGSINKPAWIIKWNGPSKKKDGAKLELISREPLPKQFREGYFNITVFDKWSADKVQQWMPKAGTGKTFKWFQAFPWAKRADGKKLANSTQVWNTIQKEIPSWELKSVLDFGCHTGFYSFEAAKHGAVVTAYDKDKRVLSVARTIARHIESQDINIIETDSDKTYDVIFFMSVLHQYDPKYIKLQETIERFMQRCNHLFLELIVAGVPGIASERFVDSVVQQDAIMRYTHNVRGVRKLWHITK